MADMKVRINHEQGSWLYYPDLVLACDPSDHEPLFVQRPCLLVEVLSPSTEQTDTREKLLTYRLLPSLREYLLLRQDVLQADLYQRGDDGRWPACPRPVLCCAMWMRICPNLWVDDHGPQS